MDDATKVTDPTMSMPTDPGVTSTPAAASDAPAPIKPTEEENPMVSGVADTMATTEEKPMETMPPMAEMPSTEDTTEGTGTPPAASV